MDLSADKILSAVDDISIKIAPFSDINKRSLLLK